MSYRQDALKLNCGTFKGIFVAGAGPSQKPATVIRRSPFCGFVMIDTGVDEKGAKKVAWRTGAACP